MKKAKTKMKNKKRSLIATALVCLALLTTVTTATYAWFSINTTVTVGVSSLTAVTGDSIEISDDGSSWGSSVSLTLDELDSTVTDISGDGKDFYKKSGYVSTDYVEFELQFRASSYYEIYLNSLSTVTPNATVLTGASADNKSSYGNFSKDLIAGAVRVAFLFNGEVQLVWAPNSNYTLSGSAGNYTVSLTDTTEKTYSYATANNTENGGTFGGKSFLSTGVIDNTSGTKVYTDKNPVATIVPDVYGVSKSVAVTVRIWIDGNDPECVNPFLGGIFNTTLGFTAQELTQEARPAATSEKVEVGGLITGYKVKLTDTEVQNYEVSTDNGTTYVAYNADTIYKNQNVLVRKKATATGNGIPSASTTVVIGKIQQAAPNEDLFTTDAKTRTLSSTSYATGTAGGALQYSTDNGANYTNLTEAATLQTLAKTNILIRYAANGDYEASEAVTVTMLGKRQSPTSAVLTMGEAGTGLVTVQTGYKYILAGSIGEAESASTLLDGGTQEQFTDGQIIGLVFPGDEVNYVDSDMVFFQLNLATGTATQVYKS